VSVTAKEQFFQVSNAVKKHLFCNNYVTDATEAAGFVLYWIVV
jgi:hypothetical protein